MSISIFVWKLHNCQKPGLSTIGMYGSQYGYTIINFVLVYFVGAYLRVNKITLSKKKAGMWIIRCLAFLYAFSMMEHVLHNDM